MAKHNIHQIKRIEARESIGSYGAWRKSFCEKYLQLLEEIRNNTHNGLLNILDLKKETITCRKGCYFCCYQHITTSLAQGIVIVNYLYSNEMLLKQFLRNYPKWRHSGKNISDTIDHVREEALSTSQSLASAISSTKPLSERYFQMSIPCPFLVNSICAIYCVRPMCCSSHYSVSPPEWCEATNPNEPTIHEVIPKDVDIYRLAELDGPQLTLFELTLPTLIYRLLTEGLSSLLKSNSK